MRFIIVICLGFCAIGLYGQAITEDPAITRMMESYIAYNKMHQTVRGWRVQIMVTSDRRQMERARRKFELTYPEYELKFTHENPYYHLKTGAFLTQQSARPVLQELRANFPGAFIVAEDIELEEVLRYQ